MLRQFVEVLPDGVRAAFEFRHTSWHDAEVFDVLRARNLALCVADSEKMSSTPVEMTADYAYSAPRRGIPADGHRALGRDDLVASPTSRMPSCTSNMKSRALGRNSHND